MGVLKAALFVVMISDAVRSGIQLQKPMKPQSVQQGVAARVGRLRNPGRLRQGRCGSEVQMPTLYG